MLGATFIEVVVRGEERGEGGGRDLYSGECVVCAKAHK
jgi:hypothetical protein